ncbi:Ig-like domain-containing protein [Nocardioides sp. SR21]|uniref:Ig-like domain-containing protein n=1 Tax=Nocardioides sp. SR21 TaxID=2919501 RepID=UPI001FAA93B4|nr:Ig-like domain-containing protein [Nocardioides sp. SR21]
MRRLLARFIALATVASGLVVVGALTHSAEAAWTAPSFVRSIGGNGRPGVFPWGAQYNPVSNEIIVGDYLNNQVRRYTPDGRIIGSFYRPNSTGQPYSIGVDPRNGDIYVPEIADGQPGNKVAQYTKDGVFVKALTLNGIDYQAWITIDGNGNLVQADSHYSNDSGNRPQVRVWRLSDGRNTKSFNIWPSGTTSSNVPRIYGIDVDASGNFWLTDTMNNRILKYNSAGTSVTVYGNGEFHGDARGMAVDDARNRLYVSDPSVGQVRVYNLQGQFLEAIGGGAGVGALNLGSARQPAVAPNGTLYVAEYGNARVHMFTADGDDAGYFPRPAQPPVAGQFGEPRDVDVDDETGDVWVADSWNQRVQRFKATGEFIDTFGTRSASPEYGMNYPRGIGIDPASRRVWVANQRGHHIKRYEYDGTFVDQLGNAESDSEAVGSFRWPLDIEFYGGKAVVSDRNSTKVKILDAATGAETSSFTRSGNHGMAIDPANGNIYVADGTKIYQYNPTGTSLTRSFGSSGTGDGQFKHIWDMVVSNGVLYVTDDQASRIQAFSTTGTFLGKWGGYGQGAYQFKNPSGIAAGPDGLLYVADAGNDRITVFDPSKPRGGGSWPPPVPTISYPGNGATVPGRPVRLSGAVTDETSVASVQVAVRDNATGLWYDATNSTWSATQSWANSPLVGDSTTSMRWAWTFIGVEYGGSYHAEVRGLDAAGNTSTAVPVDFSVVAEGATDIEAPVAVLTNPAPSDSLALEPPLVISGEAADDTGTEAVEVRVRRSGTNQFLQPDGSFATTAAWMPAQLSEPATINTAWSYQWDEPVAGSYEVSTRTYDVLANTVQTVLGEFELTAVLPPDTTPMTLDQLSPGLNATVKVSQSAIAGVANDDRSVASVDVAIRDKSTNLWLRSDGTWGAFGWLTTTLANPGAASTAFSRSWPATPGSYGFQLRSADASGNATSVAFRSFTVISDDTVPDTTAPAFSQLLPGVNAVVPASGADITGVSTDDRVVASVDVAIKDKTTNLWLKADGTWQATFVWVPATLGSPGSASTTFTRTWAAAPGSYGYQLRTADTSGNTTNQAFRSFTVN